MSRTTIEIPIKSTSIDDVINIVVSKSKAAGFQEKIVDGETIWKKGDGVLTKMQCIGTAFTGKSVILQAWLKDAITGESNLEGLAAMIPKRNLIKLLDEICNTIKSSEL